MSTITRAETQPDGTPSSMSARYDQPLIGVVVQQNGEEVVRSFADEDEADKALAGEDSIQAALSVLGAWRDLDWEETTTDLERIRHQSTPTPPIDDLWLPPGHRPVGCLPLLERPAVVALVSPWIRNREAATSILVYGEIAQHLQRPGFQPRGA